MAFIRSTAMNGGSNRDQQTYLSTEFKYVHVGNLRELSSSQYYPPIRTDDAPTFSDDSGQLANFRSTLSLAGVQNSFFGHSISIGSDKVVVGAPQDTTGAGANTGAAYIISPNYSDASTSSSNPYLGVGFGYSSYVKITRPDSTADTWYGWWVASGANRIAVGAPHDGEVSSFSGAVFLYDAFGNLIKKLTLSEWGDTNTYRFFGSAISIGSGRIVVGSYNDSQNGSEAGAAYIYDLNGNAIRKITPSDGAAGDRFGWCVSVSSGRIVVGAPFDDDNGSASGSAYVFDLAGNQIAKIKPPVGQAGANFGRSVAVAQQRIIVGAPDETILADFSTYTTAGAAYLFGMSGTYMKRIIAGDVTNPSGDQSSGALFGASVAIGDSKIIIGQPYRGATDVGALFSTDLNGNLTTPSSNAVAYSSRRDVVGSSTSDTYGMACAIGNGICCVGGSGYILNTGDGSDVNGTIKIGKSLGSTSTTNLSTPLRGLQTVDPVARNRDLLDCLDER